MDDISKKIEILEEKIKMKESEETLQTERLKNMQKQDREKVLEERVRVLETFVVRLEEKLELFEQEKNGVGITDYSNLDHLHPLVRTNSLEIKCDECDVVTRNKARRAKHKENTHSSICEICKEWDDSFVYRGDAEIAKHKQLIHDTYDITLTEQEFENLTEEYDRQIMNGPDTPKRDDLLKKKEIKEKKEYEERERVREEAKKKAEENRLKRIEERRKKKEEENLNTL